MQQGIFESAAFSFWRHRLAERSKNLQACKSSLDAILAQPVLQAFTRIGTDIMQEPPFGAIENGREHLRRLAEHYDFSCEGGPLGNCVDFQEALRCFELMAEWIETEGDGWEPSEIQQGLIPIPDGYAEA